MEGAEYSRAYSDVGDDGEWVLERVLSHRMGRNRGECSFDWDSAGAPSGSATRVREYQCKWRGYTEPTWETAAALDRLGCGDEVAAYDNSVRTREHSTSRRRASESGAHPAAVPAPGCGPAARRLAQSQRALLESLYPYETSIGPDFHADLQRHWRVVTDVAYVAPLARTAAFLRAWGGNLDTVAPAIVYHGTRDASVDGICAHGLVVPNTDGHGVTVANGNVYGEGIYTACDGFTASAYSTAFMFVCLGLVGLQFASTRSGADIGVPRNFVIFGDADHVLPLYLVRWGNGVPSASFKPRMHTTPEFLIRCARGVPECARTETLEIAVEEERVGRELNARTDAVLHKHFRNAGPKMLRRARIEVRRLLQGPVQ
jgi:hypothetical protein